MRRLFLAAFLAALVARAEAAPIRVGIDIDSTRTSGSATGGTITTQPGFTSWDLTNVTTSGTTISEQGATFEIFGLAAANASRVRSTGANVAFRPMTSDFVFNESSTAQGRAVGLRITGLDVGLYSMRSWHFDSDPTVLNTENWIQVEVRNQGGPATTVVDKFPFSGTPALFQFEVTAVGQVKEIIFREDDAAGTTDLVDQNRARLNGFILQTAPEPATLAMGLVAVLGGVAVRRKFNR
jgi:hypothetical protein